MAAWHSEAFFYVGQKLNEVTEEEWRKKYLHELNIALQNN